MKRIVKALAPLILVVGIAACSPATAGQPATGGPAASLPGGAPAGTTVVASGLVFKQASVTVDAGAPISLHFVNQDQAPHNVAIFSDAAFGTPVFTGDVIQAGEVTYQVPSLKAGTYFFRCDVHPDMKGEIVAR